MRNRDGHRPIFGLFLLFLVSMGCQSQAEWEGEHGLLAIHSEPGHFYLVDPQGHETEIAQNLGVYGLRSAVWSPSGKVLTYLCRMGEDFPWLLCNVEIATMTLQKYSLPHNGNITSFAWTENQSSILLLWGREIWRLETATGRLTMLSQLRDDADATQNYVSWSPDGSRIAFVTRPRLRTGTENPSWKGQDLYIQNADGTARKLIYQDVGGDPTWSPDGSRIAFRRDGACWIAVEGGPASCTKESARTPMWSPDGQSIAFFSEKAISVVDTRTGQVHTIFRYSGEGNLYDLSWSPDGRYFAFTTYCCMRPNDTGEIHVVTSDGAKHWQVTNNQRPDEYPTWQPIGAAGGASP